MEPYRRLRDLFERLAFCLIAWARHHVQASFVGISMALAARLACVAVTLSCSIGSIIARRSPPGDPIAFTAASVLLAAAVMLTLALALAGIPALAALILTGLAVSRLAIRRR